MLSVAVGGTWAARQNGEEVFGLAAIGDGGTSTGEFHEALNLASVLKVPVLFLIENNQYAFSTPTTAQYHCWRLSDRAYGYGISGRTIDGTDVGEVYDAVYDVLEAMHNDPMPAVIECDETYGSTVTRPMTKGAYVDPCSVKRPCAAIRCPIRGNGCSTNSGSRRPTSPRWSARPRRKSRRRWQNRSAPHGPLRRFTDGARVARPRRSSRSHSRRKT